MSSFRRSTPSSSKSFIDITPEQERKIKKNYQSYKTRAEKKKIDFTIPYYVFKLITYISCYYCKHKVEQSTVGINNEGYVSGNCVPCCWDCNRLKSNKTMSSHLSYLKRFNPSLKIKGNPLVVRWDDDGYRLEPYRFTNE